MLTEHWRDQVTICFTTKDRWADLARTIDHLCELGLDNVPALILDDGSAQPLGPETGRRLKRCRVIRHETSAGLIVRRNELARNVETPFLLSLDDDSYPLPGSRFDEAIHYLEEHPKVDVLGFRIHEPRIPPPARPRHCAGESACPVRSYIGCGHLIRVSAFMGRSGYRPFLFHMSEERDYSLRVYAAGHEVVYFPAVEILHERSPEARSSPKNAFYGARNTLLLWILNVPFPQCVWRMLRSAAGLVYASFREQIPLGRTFAGIAAALPLAVQLGPQRVPMTAERYRNWAKLPETGDR